MKKCKQVVDIMVAIIGMALSITLFVLTLIYFTPFLPVQSGPPENEGIELLYFFISLFFMAIYVYLFIFIVWFGLFLCLLISAIKKHSLKGVVIAAFVLSVLLLIFCIPLLGSSKMLPYSVSCCITLLIVMILCIISLRLGRNRTAPISQQPPLPPTPPVQASQTVEQKIAELTRLKEIGFISKEQFDQAVNNIIKNLT